MKIAHFNKLPRPELHQELFKCCSSLSWVESLTKRRPYRDFSDLIEQAKDVWFNLPEKDWLEAFSGHPQIGNLSTLKEKYSSTTNWASGEQSSVEFASDKVLKDLKDLNDTYYRNFGFIFIVCATGKSASEMLDLLRLRINNTREQEIKNAADEQFKITKLRLEKL